MTDNKLDELIEEYTKLAIYDNASPFIGCPKEKNKAKQAILAYAEGERKELLNALEFAHGAIWDAISLNDGLDGATGMKVLKMIEPLFDKYKVLYTPIKEGK